MPAYVLQIELLTGLGAGRQATFTVSPITFGRDMNNTLALTEPTVSRRHGEIRLEAGVWVLVNLSPNGTRVNSHNVTTKPHPLRNGDVLAIGATPLLRVTFGPELDNPQPAPRAAKFAVKVPANNRTRLWIALGVWWAVVLALLVFFLTLNGPQADNSPQTAELTRPQIAQAIHKPLPSHPPDPTLARKRLADATDLYNSIEASPANLFQAYRAYQEALCYANRAAFADPLDQLRFQNVQEKLIAEVTRRYNLAYTKLRSEQYAAAADEFARLSKLLADPDSPIFQNAEAHQKAARVKAGKR